MPHGKLLSDYEKGQINAFITCGKKKLQIAKLLDRSPTVIWNYLTFCSLNTDKYEYIQALHWTICRNMEISPDNEPIHCGNRVKQFLTDDLIKIMDFPSFSPDLNPIENVWSYIVRIKNESRRQFHCIDGAILAVWSANPLTYFQGLVSSMNNRVPEVVSKKGASTHY